MASLPVEKKGSVNSILKRVSKGPEKWLKYVVCPVYESSCDPAKTPFTIFHAIDNEGAFKAIVLFFHVLSELGMVGIAEDLAGSVTGFDTLSVVTKFTERRLKKIQMVSLRLGLAKVFLALERTDTDGRLLGNLKTALEDPTGEKSLCQLFKSLEDGKKISYQDYSFILSALDTCDLEKQKEELVDFFSNTNPFLPVLNKYNNPLAVSSPQSHQHSSRPSPLQSLTSQQPISTMPSSCMAPPSFMPSSLPPLVPQWSHYSKPADPSYKSAPSQLTSSAGGGYYQADVPSNQSSLPSSMSSTASSHSSFSSSDNDGRIPGRRPLQIDERRRGRGRGRGRARGKVRAPLLASHSDELPHGDPPAVPYQHQAQSLDYNRERVDSESEAGGHTSRLGSTGSSKGNTTRSNSFNTNNSSQQEDELRFELPTDESEHLASQYNANLSLSSVNSYQEPLTFTPAQREENASGYGEMIATASKVIRKVPGGSTSRMVHDGGSVSLTSGSSETSQLQSQPHPQPPPQQQPHHYNVSSNQSSLPRSLSPTASSHRTSSSSGSDGRISGRHPFQIGGRGRGRGRGNVRDELRFELPTDESEHVASQYVNLSVSPVSSYQEPLAQPEENAAGYGEVIATASKLNRKVPDGSTSRMVHDGGSISLTSGSSEASQLQSQPHPQPPPQQQPHHYS